MVQPSEADQTFSMALLSRAAERLFNRSFYGFVNFTGDRVAESSRRRFKTAAHCRRPFGKTARNLKRRATLANSWIGTAQALRFVYFAKMESMSSPTPYPSLWLMLRTRSSLTIRASRLPTGKRFAVATAWLNIRTRASK